MKFLKSIVCILFLGLIAACSGSAGNSPEGAAKAFVEKSYAGDADAVIAMVDIPDELKSEAGVEEMLTGKVKAGVAQEKRKAEELGGIDKITVLKFEPLPNNDSKGTVTIETTFKGGRTVEDRVKVIRTENGWKISL